MTLARPEDATKGTASADRTPRHLPLQVGQKEPSLCERTQPLSRLVFCRNPLSFT